MTLKKWTTGDTITERSANNKGVRKGLEADITGIATADKEVGDHYYNETANCPQVLFLVTGTKRINVRNFLAADANEVNVVGSTAVQVKNTSFIKNPTDGFAGNRIFIVAEIKRTGGGTGSLRIRKNLGGSDELVLTTTSTTYEIKTGQFSIEPDSNGRITLEFFLDESGGGTMFNQELEVYGI